ncbi:MAG TPA: LPS export ABC transporter periplasmic protein LptC [Candidatus Sulfotelmatobacter sp.]|nr:LPS export ABC transporter periplasmic protein LptC [Candidatus Sulfotelmatobacter sp.]
MKQLALAGVLALVAASPAPSPSRAPAPKAAVGSRYYTVETPQAHWNPDSGAFTASGPVKLTQPGLVAYADNAVGNTKDGTAVLTGHVRVHDNGTSGGTIAGSAKEPSTLTCDELDVNGKLDAYRAAGNAHYASVDRTASADTMILDRKHHKLYLDGAVALSQHGSTLVGDRVNVNLRSGQTDESGSPLVITAPASSAPAPRGSGAPATAPPHPGPMLAPLPGITPPQRAPVPTPLTPLPSPSPSHSP